MQTRAERAEDDTKKAAAGRYVPRILERPARELAGSSGVAALGGSG